MFSIGEALILLTATISPFLNVKEMFSSFFLSTFVGYAFSGILCLDPSVSFPPILVPHRPLLIEYVFSSQFNSIPFFF